MNERRLRYIAEDRMNKAEDKVAQREEMSVVFAAYLALSLPRIPGSSCLVISWIGDLVIHIADDVAVRSSRSNCLCGSLCVVPFRAVPRLLDWHESMESLSHMRDTQCNRRSRGIIIM